MFAQLKTMLRKGDTVSVTVAIEDDTQLRVNVFPKLFTLDGEHSDNRKALNTPLSIVATPEELDGPAFIETLTKLGASTNTLRHTLDELEEVHKKAASDAKSKPAAKPAGKPVAKKTAPGTRPVAKIADKSAAADEDDEDGEEGEEESADQAAVDKAAEKPAAKPADDNPLGL